MKRSRSPFRASGTVAKTEIITGTQIRAARGFLASCGCWNQSSKACAAFYGPNLGTMALLSIGAPLSRQAVENAQHRSR